MYPCYPDSSFTLPSQTILSFPLASLASLFSKHLFSVVSFLISAMGEPLLAAYLQTLLDKLDSGPLLNFARQAGFRSELRTWRSKLLQVRRVLCDAEEKQVSDREVKKWLDNLRDLAYSADDVLDELRYEALQRQNNSSSGSATSSSQVQDLLAQIREITTRFLDIEEDKNDLGLKERPGVRSSIIANRLPTTSLVDSSQIVGREKDVDAILKLLDIGETTKLKKSRVISILDKVEDVEDALVINLMNKKNIEELEFRWWGGENLDNTENAESQVQILNLLEPRKMLRNLVIEGYCGVTLPNWIGDSLYSKMGELSLINCERCKSLPSLGQLPLLQKLTIEGMLEMETIGTELYGEASLHGQPFPSLKTLKFYKMPKWVNWSLPVGITSLLHLKIIDCPQLVVPVLATFPSLQHLTVAGVENISSGVHCLTSLTELSIRGCENLQTLPDGIISSNSNLQVLEIRDCTSLESFPSGVLPSTLERLSIRGCENLQTLPDGIISSNSNLQVLKIRDCTSLESFPSGVLPSTLKRLSIRSCRKLESISEMLLVPTSIDRIEFFEYPNLKSLPECLCTNISYLCIEKCESIESFPETGLPSPNITCLEIRSCENLKYLPGNLPKLTSLTELCVEKQMWDEWTPSPKQIALSKTLVHLGRIQRFPAQESQSLLPPILTSLIVQRLANLESLSSCVFSLNKLGLPKASIFADRRTASIVFEVIYLWLLRTKVQRRRGS
ncbi:Rx, N-terminal [Dillenia turbinata]|uniref:Rx, N-terminal n=1 Tax=Dillenia turbinata TaxID=194707 RepID=A0AAN8VUQ2_9MAGN